MKPTTAYINDEMCGALTASPDNDCPDYDVKRVLEYCRAQGKSPEALTESELAAFVEPQAKRKTA